MKHRPTTVLFYFYMKNRPKTPLFYFYMNIDLQLYYFTST